MREEGSFTTATPNREKLGRRRRRWCSWKERCRKEWSMSMGREVGETEEGRGRYQLSHPFNQITGGPLPYRVSPMPIGCVCDYSPCWNRRPLTNFYFEKCTPWQSYCDPPRLLIFILDGIVRPILRICVASERRKREKSPSKAVTT